MADERYDGEGAPGKSGKRYSPHYQRNNAGGHGNPPVKNQFKKGNPGGPGRPKGQTNVDSLVRRILGKKLSVRRNGTTVEMLPAQVWAERAVETILKSPQSVTMLEYGRRFLEEHAPNDDLLTQANFELENLSALSKTELTFTSGLLAKACGEAPKYPRKNPLGSEYDEPPFEGLYRLSRREDGHFEIARVEEAYGAYDTECK